MIKLIVIPDYSIGSKNRVLTIWHEIFKADGLWLVHLAYLAKRCFNPPLSPLTEHGLKMALEERAGVLEVPFGVGFSGGKASKRFVEQGDNSPLFGEWGDGNRYFAQTTLIELRNGQARDKSRKVRMIEVIDQPAIEELISIRPQNMCMVIDPYSSLDCKSCVIA